MSDNGAIDNGTGYFAASNVDLGPVIMRSNLAVGAGTGFAVNPGRCPSCTMSTSNNFQDQVLSNVAERCDTGFVMYEVGRVEGNTASGNSVMGFRIDAPVGQSFRNNSALGNGGPGVIVNFSPDEFDVQNDGGGFSTFSQNNFYGNDRNRPVITLNEESQPELNPGPSAHCGVLNVGALAAISGPAAVSPPPTITIQATKNFWGSATGPASTGVGDAVGGPCDQNGGVTIGKPFATTPYAITSVD